MNIKILFLALAFLLNIIGVNAQKKKIVINGKITNKTKEALVGVTVFEKGSFNASISDVDGNFSIEGNFTDTTILVFSYMGMKTLERRIVPHQRMDVLMQEKKYELGEVIVKARQNINEIDIRARSGSVETVDMTIIRSKPTIDIAVALQGSVPGLVITNTGELGSRPQVRIRGNSSLREGNMANEPLYVMDGKVISAETFFELNPSDIKEILVLKDAVACALYGIKAANGVLEITSYRGINDKPQISFNVEAGVTMQGRRGVRLMDSEEKLKLEYLLGINGGACTEPGYRYSEEFIRKYNPTAINIDELITEGKNKLNRLKKINTDWFNELIKTNTFQRYNLSLRGGNENQTYYISGSYSHQGGRIEGNDKQRFSLALNSDHRIKDKGYLMLSVNGACALSNTPNGSSYDITSLVYKLNPYESPTSGELYSYPGQEYSDLFNQFSGKLKNSTIGASASINITPIEGLDVSSVLGLDFMLDENVQITPSTAYSERTKPVEAKGKYFESKGNNINISTNTRVTYIKTINEKHRLTLGINYDYYHSVADNISILGHGIGKLTFASAINQGLTGAYKPTLGAIKNKSMILLLRIKQMHHRFCLLINAGIRRGH